MPSSSALGLADLALLWDNTQGNADLSTIDGDLSCERGLATAMLLSLFLDRRATNDDVPPSGDPNDKRGWWADQFAEVDGDLIGSRLWLLDRAVLNNETLLQAKHYATECWQWVLDDKVASGIDTGVTFMKDSAGREIGILIAPTVSRPGKDPVTFKFAHVWDHVQEDL